MAHGGLQFQPIRLDPFSSAKTETGRKYSLIC
jgi:hypothetical protein